MILDVKPINIVKRRIKNNIYKENNIGPETKTKFSIWYTKSGDRIINNIIDKTLDLNLKIGKETKNALLYLMKKLETKKEIKYYSPNQIFKDGKGREYVSFNCIDFQQHIKSFHKGNKQYGGIIYLIEILNNYYIGLTERNIKIRFEEHLMDAMREFIPTKGDLNRPGYGKLQKKIVEVLRIFGYNIKETYEKLQFYSSSQLYDKRKTLINEILKKINPIIKTNIIELHYTANKLGLQEHRYIKYFPIRTLIENKVIDLTNYKGPDYIDLKIQGLNMIYGGSSQYLNLPMYDIAIMIAMGLSAPKISKILRNDYGLSSATIRAVQQKIADIFGGSYHAQEMFLKPIIEYIIGIKGITRYNVYIFFKESERSRLWMVC